MIDPHIISFYTKNTLYETEVKDLIFSCKALNLEYSIEGVSSLGSWEENCCYKPKFILEKLNELKRPVLWVDADAFIFKKPLMGPLLKHEIGFVSISENNRPLYYNSKETPAWINTATLFFNYSKRTLKFLEKWSLECQRQFLEKQTKVKKHDQTILYNLIYEKQHPIKVYHLPISYCRIFDRDNGVDFEKDTYIMQFQASRLYKNMINNNLEMPVFLKNMKLLELKKLRMQKERKEVIN